MDFELSKENILPLPGGRDVQQLNMALQAQTNRESQMELMQQKAHWEELLKNYTGEDPLENYYKYVSWIEQTFPKHGHEGNLIQILEHCLGIFEDDKRYQNDRRFCKLWIKYIDLKSNPIELYHMMKAKGLCIGCADFYKAWAYYHEAAGDFQSANKVFEEGKRNCAQPYEELEHAHQNMIMAAGQHVIFGPDENRLSEKRHALTSLRMLKSGRVSSIRVPSNAGQVTVPSTSSTGNSNQALFIHEDRPRQRVLGIPEAPPISIIAAAKRQVVTKENSLKAGPWSGSVPVKKRVIGKGTAEVATGFLVHEDDECDDRFPKNIPKTCLEDYSTWNIEVSYPDPLNNRDQPMYPKHIVYSTPKTELSLEEIRQKRYNQRYNSTHVVQNNNFQHLQPSTSQQNSSQLFQQLPQFNHNTSNNIQSPMQRQNFSINPQMSPMFGQQNVIANQQMQEIYHSPINQQLFLNHNSLHMQHSPTKFQKISPMQTQHHTPVVSPVPTQHSIQNLDEASGIKTNENHNYRPCADIHIFEDSVEKMQDETLGIFKPSSQDHMMVNNANQGWSTGTGLRLWDDSKLSDTSRFFEQSPLEKSQHKVRAMKTAFKDSNADELVETGSRHGMDVAVTAQVIDSAKRTSPNYGFPEDTFNGDDSVNTQVFSSLGAMSVSTPIKQEQPKANVTARVEPKILSMIEEEKSWALNGSSSGSGSGSYHPISTVTLQPTISEEHHNNLAQNMRANAALRSSLLGNLVDLGPTKEETSVELQINQSYFLNNSTRNVPPPTSTIPLDYVPFDPFEPKLINKLLERVVFPGPHTYGFIQVPSIPKPTNNKKEQYHIGREYYVVEKQLGKGTFGTVYKAQDLGSNTIVAMKYQKPANKWEYYICRELQSRLSNNHLRENFMDIPLAYFCEQASLIISTYMPDGSLLDLANTYKLKMGKPMKECLVVYFCIRMLEIIQAMHQVKIIHADIKPDNFLVYITPNNYVDLQLIDFGCSIDMSLFPPGASFRKPVTTENFVCCEMIDNRPWNYHTDLFCVGATAHVLLFDSYIKLQRNDGSWSISQRFPRYLKVDLWNTFFSNLLNQQNGPADAASLIVTLKNSLDMLNRDTSAALPRNMRDIVNFLKNR